MNRQLDSSKSWSNYHNIILSAIFIKKQQKQNFVFNSISKWFRLLERVGNSNNLIIAQPKVFHDQSSASQSQLIFLVFSAS